MLLLSLVYIIITCCAKKAIAFALNLEVALLKDNTGKAVNVLRLMFKNLMSLAFYVLFAIAFQLVFGSENILLGVAISVGLTTLPKMELGIRTAPMCFIIMLLYALAGVASQSALMPAWAAMPVNFAFVILILLLIAEPMQMKPSISFILCFIFGQSFPVPADRLWVRMACLIFGGALVSLRLFFSWRKNGIGINGCSLAEQIKRCAENRSYIFRSAFGIAVAMMIGMLMGLRRPMWVSIVVMSFTQADFAETRRRILHRSIATVAGSIIFTIVLVRYIPVNMVILFTLALSYAGFFTEEYKYKQIINSVCALNASLIILSPEEAVALRFAGLAAGIAIALAVWALEYILDAIKETCSDCGYDYN